MAGQLQFWKRTKEGVDISEEFGSNEGGQFEKNKFVFFLILLSILFGYLATIAADLGLFVPNNVL